MSRQQSELEEVIRGLDNQEGRAGTVKIAATLIATVGVAIASACLALAGEHHTWREVVVASLLALGISGIATFLIDRRIGIDPLIAIERSSSLSDSQQLQYFSALRMACYRTNEESLLRIQIALT